MTALKTSAGLESLELIRLFDKWSFVILQIVNFDTLYGLTNIVVLGPMVLGHITA